MESEVKVYENRLRRAAKRQGLELKKNRRRDQWALGYGGWWLIDANTNTMVAGGQYGTDLGSIEAYLNHEGTFHVSDHDEATASEREEVSTRALPEQ